MSFARRALLSLVALTAVSTAVGCGRTSGAPTAAPRAAGAAQAFKAGGETRAFGYNVDRYQTVLSKTARKVTMPRQGLRPSKIDLREKCPPIYNQGAIGSCTAFSMGKGLREFMQRANGERTPELSALWLYYEERVHMGQEWIAKDSGANMADGMHVLKEQGCALDVHAPYVPNMFADKPRQAAYDSAAEWKIKESIELASFDDVKTALAAGKPVAFGFIVYARFQFIGKDGMMTMPWKFEPKMGGHAVLAVGYDDAQERLIVRNSWGSGWGDKGYFYMPYKFAADKEKAMEFFTAK